MRQKRKEKKEKKQAFQFERKKTIQKYERKKVAVNWQEANKTFTVEHKTKKKWQKEREKTWKQKKYIDDM